MNNEQTLLDLGFKHHSLFDMGAVKGWRLEKDGKVFRAHVQQYNPPVYVIIGEVVDHQMGLVKRWKDCVSASSVERFIDNQLSVY